MENQPFYGSEPLGSIRSECLRPFEHWEIPTGNEIRIAMKMAGLSGSQLASLTGIKNSRTIRRWTGEEVEIPYAVWAILCYQARLGIIWA